MRFGFYAGETDKTIYLRLRDSTTGLAKTGLAFNSAGAVCSYVLPLAARAAITLATQTVTGAHSDGGFVEVDATNCKGLYRLDLPDAAIASGSFSVVSIEFDGTIEESILLEIDTQKVNATQFAGQTITAAAGVTLPSSVASPTNITAGTITTVTNLTNLPSIPANWLTAAGTAVDFSTELRTAINGGDYALDTDANGRIRIVDGTAAGELNTASGSVDVVTIEGSDATDQINAACDAAIETYHLDHLLAVAYDPASKPGAADALLNELIENDGGVARFTANALEQAPTGGGTGLTPLAGGTAQSGTTSTIVLDAAESFGDDILNGNIVKILSGTGAGQSRMIVDYVGATDTATVMPNWGTAPDATSVYEIIEGPCLYVSHLSPKFVSVESVGSMAITSSSFSVSAITDNSIASNAITSAKIAANAIGSSQLAASAVTEIQTGLSILTEANIRTAVGLASANLDTQLDTLPTADEVRNAVTGGAYSLSTDANGMVRIVDGTGVGELNTSGGFIAGIAGTINTLDALDTAQDVEHDATQAAIAALNNISVANVLTTQMTQSYAANGVAPTLAQALFAIHQKLMARQYSGLNSPVYQLDGVTEAFRGTMDDATNPTEDIRVPA